MKLNMVLIAMALITVLGSGCSQKSEKEMENK